MRVTANACHPFVKFNLERNDDGNPSAACRSALADATRLCPQRSRSYDGIMGDTRHAARRSDHNDGNAFDLTHDPDNGIDCNLFAKLALLDRRVQYVIWNRKSTTSILPCLDGAPTPALRTIITCMCPSKQNVATRRWAGRGRRWSRELTGNCADSIEKAAQCAAFSER